MCSSDLGNVMRERDPRSFETLYDRDHLGRVTRLTRPAGLAGNDEQTVEVFRYDAGGNRVSYQDPRGSAYTKV